MSIDALMKNLSAIGKDGYNNGFNFAFRGIDQIIEHVGRALREEGMSLATEVKQLHVVAPGHVVCVMRYVIRDSDGKEVGSYEALGEGKDNQDKAAYKAMAGAMKYAIGHGLAIPYSYDDPDAAEPVQQQAAPPPAAEENVIPQALTHLYQTQPDDVKVKIDTILADGGLPDWKTTGIPASRAEGALSHILSTLGMAQ